VAWEEAEPRVHRLRNPELPALRHLLHLLEKLAQGKRIMMILETIRDQGQVMGDFQRAQTTAHFPRHLSEDTRKVKTIPVVNPLN